MLNQQQLIWQELNLLPFWFKQEQLNRSLINDEDVAPDWDRLSASINACDNCPLGDGCQQRVLGVGDYQADWLFVGDGVDGQEGLSASPFVGPVGRLFDNILLSIGLRCEKRVYITHVVKCRTPDNRTPTFDEATACMSYLEQQIAWLRPKVIVVLGKAAAQALLGKQSGLSTLRGVVYEYQAIPLIVTYHPASLLRTPIDKLKVWQDLQLAQSQLY